MQAESSKTAKCQRSTYIRGGALLNLESYHKSIPVSHPYPSITHSRSSHLQKAPLMTAQSFWGGHLNTGYNIWVGAGPQDLPWLTETIPFRVAWEATP